MMHGSGADLARHGALNPSPARPTARTCAPRIYVDGIRRGFTYERTVGKNTCVMRKAIHPHHARVHPWWLQTLGSAERKHVPDIVWVGFVRIVSSPRLFAVPSAVGEACLSAEAARSSGLHHRMGHCVDLR